MTALVVIEGIVLVLDVGVGPRHLMLSVGWLIGEHPVEFEHLPLLECEGSPLVQKGIGEDGMTPLPDVGDDPVALVIAFDSILHLGASWAR